MAYPRSGNKMGRIVLLFAACAGLASLTAGGGAQEPDFQASYCKAVEDALKESDWIKPGMTRQEVEKHFDRDSGLQFAESTTYTRPKCPYIKLKVEYKHLEKSKYLLSPDDTVISVSQLFIEYLRRD
jgi:hypothetical protein